MCFSAVPFFRESRIENNQFSKFKTWISNLHLNSALNGTVVNWTLPYFHGGSLEIELTVPLRTCEKGTLRSS